MDQIRIDNLCVFAHHGVFETETKEGQNFYVNAILYSDLQSAGKTDDLDASTDYGKVCEYISVFLKENTYQLLEAAAHHLAEGLLITFPKIKSLSLEIRKPQAPIPLPFESVSVKIDRGWHDVYLSFGSNMGEKEKHIKEGLKQIKEHTGCRLLKISKFYETEPYGDVVQENFLNGVCHIQTLLTPEELLTFLHDIEKQEKRERIIHWGPRTLDLDILFYDSLIYESDDLVIPHIDLENRLFVLEPLEEIAPNFRHPISHLTIGQLKKILKQKNEA